MCSWSMDKREQQMKELERLSVRAMCVWLGCMIVAESLIWPSSGWAKEIAFVAHDVEDQQAVWLPGEVVLHQTTDLTEPLMFRFDNPTARTHVFEAPGLLESIEANGVQTTRPVRITIAPEMTEQIVIDRSQMTHDAIAGEKETVTYRFYCPLHRADDDAGGIIIIGP